MAKIISRVTGRPPAASKATKVGRREFIYSTLAAVMGFTLSGCIKGESLAEFNTEQESESYFFIQIADPQLFWGPLSEWEKAIDHVNRLKPAFVAVCGDLISDPGMQEEADAYLKTAKKLDSNIPLYNVAGNHDIGNEPTVENIQWYEKNFGKIWYSFTYKKSLCIVLDTNIIKAPKSVTDLASEQMQWLRETLKAAEKKNYQHKFIFTHFPLCLKSIDEADEYFNIPVKQRAELLGLFHKYDATAVFSGHYHRNAYVKDEALELITTSSCGKALGDDPLGFRIVKVYPTHIEHSYYAYEELPEKVEL